MSKSKGLIAPGQRLPKGAYWDKTGKLVYPKNPPRPQVVMFREPDPCLPFSEQPVTQKET